MTYHGAHTPTSHLNGSSEFLRHEPCPDCGSSDALSVYSDGHTYCFSCTTHTNGDGTHSTQMNYENLKGQAQRLNKRGLSEKTCEFYKIYRDGQELRFHYFTSDGILQGAKVKTKNKIFTYEGISTDTLFGQHLFPSTGRRIVITEGELDAASCYEAMPNWPMVSLPHGAAGAKKDIQKCIPLLQGYEEIVLFFDSDEAGRKAAEAAASILPPGKVKIARMEAYKDPSDALQDHEPESIRRAIWDATPFRPDGIVEGRSLLSLITTPQEKCQHEYPYHGLQRLTHGIRYGELTCLTSGSGLGKSTFCRELATHLLSNGERVGYVALEESNRRTALGLMSSACGKSLHIGEHDTEELEEAFNASMAGWNLYLFDGFGSFDPDLVYNRIEYLATGLDTKVVFLDHLSILLSGLDGDERRMLDQTMTNLRSLVERTGIHLFLVSHLRRTQNDRNHEEGARVTLGQLRGSASIAQLSDTVIALERDQQADAESSATTVRVLKNRYSGEVGIACHLDYDLQTNRFIENEVEDFNPTTDF